jgi:hypothetical protein
MSASFITLSDKDLFKSGSGAASHMIKIPEVDNVVDISGGGLALYDSVALHSGETIQYFLTFDDVIKYIHFGKALGTIIVEGTMFSNCKGELPGLKLFHQAISKLRGVQQEIVLGEKTFTVVMSNSNVNIQGDPLTHAKFTFNFSVIDHDL